MRAHTGSHGLETTTRGHVKADSIPFRSVRGRRAELSCGMIRQRRPPMAEWIDDRG